MDIDTYRKNIGYFNQIIRNRKISSRKCVEYLPVNKFRKKEEYLPVKHFVRRSVIIASILVSSLVLEQTFPHSELFYGPHTLEYVKIRNLLVHKGNMSLLVYLNGHVLENYISEGASHRTFSLQSPNRYAKITYGNKMKSRQGIKNCHLNIRSIIN